MIGGVPSHLTPSGRAATSSPEIYREDENVEMTDFATHPGCRGRNLPGYLLTLMEEVMRAAGMRTAFTIARGLSYPINSTFARAGYLHGGTLTNNTSICGWCLNPVTCSGVGRPWCV